MSDQKPMTIPEAQKFFAVTCNNNTWDLLEKEQRTPTETEEMIHQVHAASWHWSKAGAPVNMVRAHYLVAKVYFALENGPEGQYWAERCWQQAKELELTGWDHAFASEAITRAYASAKNAEAFKEQLALTQKAISDLEDEEDRSLCQAELDRGPWFGMK
jgi:hypothetical protein